MPTTVIQSQRVANTPETNIQPSVSSILTEVEPDLFALDSILRLIPSAQRAEQQVHTWFEVGVFPIQDVITAGAAAGALYGTKVWSVQNIGMWNVDDIIMTPGNLGNPRILVESKDSVAGTITVRALDIKSDTNPNGRGTVPAITAGEVIVWLGNAKAEECDMSDAKAIYPTPYKNYAQHLDTTISASLDKVYTKNWTQQDWQRSQKNQFVEFRKRHTSTIHFGKAAYNIDAVTGLPRYAMNGLQTLLQNKLYYYTDLENGQRITRYQIIDWMTSIFRGNNGSPSRFLFADSYLHGELQKVLVDQWRSMGVVREWGVNFEKFNYGSNFLYLHHSRIFNELSMNHYGQVIDLKHIKKVPFREMAKTEVEFKKAQGKDKTGFLMEESYTLELRNTACHAEIRGISSEVEGAEGQGGAE